VNVKIKNLRKYYIFRRLIKRKTNVNKFLTEVYCIKNKNSLLLSNKSHDFYVISCFNIIQKDFIQSELNHTKINIKRLLNTK